MRARVSRALLLLSLSAAPAQLGCTLEPAPSFAAKPSLAESDGHFTVIGDLQGTLPEELLIGREDNSDERALLPLEIARTRPAFVVMLGDLVAWGASQKTWLEFDELSEPLRSTDTCVVAVPGNHDYFGGDRLRHFFARFPQLHQQSWYERRYGPLALVFLDSNAGPLGEQRWAEQREWYEQTLLRLDGDPNVRGALIFLHHAPFTNSSLVGDDPDVREAFMPAFASSPKTIALISGHAHGYERFAIGEKTLIVSGGGGGPRSPLLTGTKRRHRDEFQGPPLRNFNFVELEPDSDGLHADVIGLPKDSQRFCLMESFDLPWPDRAHRPATLTRPSAKREALARCYP